MQRVDVMNNRATISDFIRSDLHAADDMSHTYEIKLKLTREEISNILDYRLGQKIEHSTKDIEKYLSIAECIKSSNLTDEFCRYFASELTPLIQQLVSNDSDSYEITNFQHRMLRKFSNCVPTKNAS